MNSRIENEGGEVVDLHDFQSEDADQVFEFIDEGLNNTGYVRGRATSSVGFGTTVEDEQATYLSAALELLQQGYDTPNTVSNF